MAEAGADAIQILSDIPRVHALGRGDRTAVEVVGGETLTYADLERRSNQACGLVQALGAKPGDRIGWLGKNCAAWYEIMFGAAKARACLAPINTRLAVPEIAFILKDSGADLFFVTPDFFAAAREVAASIGRPIRLIAVGGEAEGFESYQALRDAAPAPALDPPRAEDDVLQLYTSGTTGLPKGVRLNNINYGAFLGLRHQVEGFDYGADDTVLIVMPLFHVAGTNISFSGLAAGGRLIVMADFNPVEVLRLIEAEKVAHIFLAPVMINALLQTPQSQTTDFSSLKTVSYGASPISEAVLKAATERFGCGFIQFYGMTETCGAGTTLAPSAHTGELLRSCGRPWATLETRISGENGETLGPRQIGEIEIRGPIVMAGYWNRPEATAETIRPDGWLRTGDAGFMDEDGYFFVHDRVKDMIVSGGENVYPAEVENAILGCPGVADAAVIGVPDERWGEAVKAVVVPAAGAAPDPEAIIAWARQRIAGFKAPKSIDFIEALPRNPSGKVLRRELRKPYWEGRDRNVG
ncbi:long-chain-fatty-acid--CoA ligase [Phenylobacterium sp. J367]|uniref:long-chain-fatty-acid--CoA ligase n=1 Tax=Phenylobacterium sp. J367 TaxID=2898435 RepID=UPI0021508AD4|nr:long-chain-fatty-acid--CoA ligase [Phenylobacterium sp. J367]MCR5878605.1 long-chain-fatty-acid--CoA ligase [Phenylobacterium sp. J367]